MIRIEVINLDFTTVPIKREGGMGISESTKAQFFVYDNDKLICEGSVQDNNHILIQNIIA